MAAPALSRRLKWRTPEVPLNLACPISKTFHCFVKDLALWGASTGYYSGVECFKEDKKYFCPAEAADLLVSHMCGLAEQNSFIKTAFLFVFVLLEAVMVHLFAEVLQVPLLSVDTSLSSAIPCSYFQFTLILYCDIFSLRSFWVFVPMLLHVITSEFQHAIFL